jgi:hypothetical protein
MRREKYAFLSFCFAGKDIIVSFSGYIHCLTESAYKIAVTVQEFMQVT